VCVGLTREYFLPIQPRVCCTAAGQELPVPCKHS